MTKVWVTKYALTDGIRETELRDEEEEYSWVFWSGATASGGILMVRKNEVFKEKESAIARAEEMRVAKIESLRRQISKLERMEIGVFV